jgi:hypothetical protein
MPSDIPDMVDVALTVARAFEGTGIAYFLGGSLASSTQGEARATNDIDFVVDLTEPQIAPLAQALGPDFEVDEVALADAVRTRGSWNLFFLPLVTKIDLFVKGDSPFDLSEFTRRRVVELRTGQSLYVKSPEDSVLRKLRWYLDGGSVSQNQLRDVTEILRVNAGRLDDAYLAQWAGQLDVEDELRRARARIAHP